MLSNALIARYRYSTFRPGQLIISATIYLTTVFLMIWINAINPDFTQHQMYKNLYLQFIILQMIVLWFVGAYGCGSVVSNEINRNSYVFFRLLPMSGVQKAAGILLGKNLLVIVAGLINFAFLVYFGLEAGVPVLVLVEVVCVLIAGALLFDTVALLTSINTNRKKATNPMVVIGLLSIFVLPQAIMMMAMKGIHVKPITVEFYYVDVSVLFLGAAIAGYYALWAFLGVVRKFTAEDRPLFARLAVVIFAIGTELILLGFFLPLIFPNRVQIGFCDVYILFWGMSLTCVWPLMFFALWRYDRYLEESSKLAVRRSHRAIGTLDIIGLSNIKVAIVNFAIWAAFAMAIWQLDGQPLLDGLAHVAVLFSFYLVLILLLEIAALCRRGNVKVLFLLGFIAIIYLGLPLILGVIMDRSHIGMLSLMGYLLEFMDMTLFDPIHWIPALLNMIYSAVLALFVVQRYRAIAHTRAGLQVQKLTESTPAD